MNKGILVGGLTLIVILLTAIGTLSSRTTDAGIDYVFWARGDVMQIDKANNTIKVYSRHNSDTGEHDLAGQTVEFNIKDARFYKYDNTLRKVRVTLGSLNEGDEVVLNGAKKNGSTYTVSKVTKNYHTVKLRGTVEGHDKANRILTIQINSILRTADKKAYRTSEFAVGTDLKVYYGSGTKILNISGTEINADEIANNREKITIDNIQVKYGSRFEAGPDAKITDGKYTF